MRFHIHDIHISTHDLHISTHDSRLTTYDSRLTTQVLKDGFKVTNAFICHDDSFRMVCRYLLQVVSITQVLHSCKVLFLRCPASSGIFNIPFACRPSFNYQSHFMRHPEDREILDMKINCIRNRISATV